VDPTGNLFGLDNAIGAGIGLGVDFAAQYASAYAHGVPFQYNYAQGAVAFGLGFATSGLSSFVGAGIAGDTALALAGRAGANIAIGAGANLAQTGILNNFDGQDGSYLVNGLAGGALGGLGSLAGDFVGGLGSLPGVNGEGISPGDANLLNGIYNTSGLTATTVSPLAVSAGSALGAGIGGLSGFSDAVQGSGGNQCH
jgi:hypothetical protein